MLFLVVNDFTILVMPFPFFFFNLSPFFIFYASSSVRATPKRKGGWSNEKRDEYNLKKLLEKFIIILAFIKIKQKLMQVYYCLKFEEDIIKMNGHCTEREANGVFL